MAGTQLQLRRGTTAQHATFTGAVGEITIDTDKKSVIVHDGSTAGGIPLLSSTGSQASTGAQTFKTVNYVSEGTVSGTTGAQTVDWTASQNYKQTEPTGAITYTFTAPAGICHLQLRILSDGASTAYTHVWPGTVKWLGSTWSAVANKNAMINFWYDGASYWAMGANEV